MYSSSRTADTPTTTAQDDTGDGGKKDEGVSQSASHYPYKMPVYADMRIMVPFRVLPWAALQEIW